MDNIKILVVSDTHGSRERLRRVCNMHPDANYLFHAGDGVNDLSVLTSFKGEKVCVNGNCDFFATHYPDERFIRVGEYNFFINHGYAYGVKFSTASLQRKALSLNANVAIFGHTHNPLEKTIPLDNGDYLYLFNPGSVRDGSFGLIQISDAGIIFSHGALK